MSIDCFINGAFAKAPKKRFVKTATRKEKKKFKKEFKMSC